MKLSLKELKAFESMAQNQMIDNQLRQQAQDKVIQTWREEVKRLQKQIDDYREVNTRLHDELNKHKFVCGYAEQAQDTSPLGSVAGLAEDQTGTVGRAVPRRPPTEAWKGTLSTAESKG